MDKTKNIKVYPTLVDGTVYNIICYSNDEYYADDSKPYAYFYHIKNDDSINYVEIDDSINTEFGDSINFGEYYGIPNINDLVVNSQFNNKSNHKILNVYIVTSKDLLYREFYNDGSKGNIFIIDASRVSGLEELFIDSNLNYIDEL